MALPQHLSLLARPVALWMANTDAQAVPALVRCTGIVAAEDGRTLTAFMPEVFCRDFRANLREAAPVTLLATDVPTYESYQYKGFFRAIRACTPEETAFQSAALDAFATVVSALGFSKEAYFKSYFHQPSLAITFEVAEVFDQTPYKGTGVSVSKAD